VQGKTQLLESIIVNLLVFGYQPELNEILNLNEVNLREPRKNLSIQLLLVECEHL